MINLFLKTTLNALKQSQSTRKVYNYHMYAFIKAENNMLPWSLMSNLHAVGNGKFAAQHFLMVHMVDQYNQCAHGPPSQYHTSPNQCNGAWVLIGTE